MNDSEFTDAQLLGYVDEMLPVELMASIERALRDQEALRRHVAGLIRRRDAGEHSLGQVWRRLRLSCPSRSELGSFLLGALDDAELDYVDFHLRVVGCRYCAANVADLEEASQGSQDPQQRRSRFFQSSAGFLPRPE